MNTIPFPLGRRCTGLLGLSTHLGPTRPPLRPLILGLVLALTAATAPGALPVTGPAVPGFEAYDQAVTAFLQKWDIPGGAVAVAHRGRIVFARGYGYADRDTGRPVQPDTRFRTQSVGKIFTAALVLKLVEDGRLSLDDRAFPMLNYPMPIYAGARRDLRLDDIRVRHLLNHSAGWVWDQAPFPFGGGTGFYASTYQREIAQAMGTPLPCAPETLIRYMMGQPLQAAPGTVWSYSTLGYEVLGRLIEQKTGMTYEEAARQFFVNSYVSGLAIGGSRRSELAADEAVYYDEPGSSLVQSSLDAGQLVPAPYAYSMHCWDSAGGWIISPIECLRILLALEGANGTPPLLRPESIAAMRTTQYPATYYGYGWFTRYACSNGDDQGHAGGSFGGKTYALRTGDGEWHMVAFFNSIRTATSVSTQFENDAYAMLHSLPELAALPHDLTWSTLGWDAWVSYALAGSSATGPLDDPNANGVPNLLEYAAGLDPLVAGARLPAYRSAATNGSRVFSYRRIVLEHPLAWTVETKVPGQENWAAASFPVRSMGVYGDGAIQMSVALPAGTDARLRVRQNSTGVEAVFADAAGSNEPVILALPDDQSVATGSAATFAVTADGQAPLRYQWTKNGVAIVGATAASLTLNNVQAADAGAYSLTVANEDGILVGSPATLTVNPPPPPLQPQPNPPAPASGGGGGGGGAPSLWFLAGLLVLHLARRRRAPPAAA